MLLKKNDKIIIGFYIFLAISFSSVVLYTATTFEDLPKPNWIPKQLTHLEFERTLEIEQETFFLIMSDIENFPKILPQNFISVNILEINENTIIAEEEIQEKGIRAKFLVKHTLISNDEHILEVLEGDAKGTKIHLFFSTDGNFTKLITTVDVNLKGILTPFSYLPESNVNSAMNTVVTSFYDYAKGFDTLEKKKIDVLYREILLRPADTSGLEYYGGLLETNQITIADIRLELSHSEEGKYVVKPNDLKQISELKNETKNTISELYEKILQREPDVSGLQHYGTLLELEKLSIDEIELALFNSEEALSMRGANLPGKKLINDLYFDLTGKNPDLDTLNYYVNLLNKIDLDSIEANSEEIKKLIVDNYDVP